MVLLCRPFVVPVIRFYILVEMVRMDFTIFHVSYACFCLFFAKGEYQVLTNSDSTRKVIEIASHLGKSMGM
jgi:hypothetical protein